MTRTAPEPDSIAIVGMAGRFPGARNVVEFWENLIAGKDTITRLTDEQLASAGYDPAAVRKLSGWVGARGIVEKPEWFDRGFFGISPKEAEVMDPQHRLFLEIAWDALEDAGCDPSRFPGLTGVFAGMSNNTYYSYFVQKRRDLLEAVGVVTAVISNEKDFLATRVAYKLNLHGPALSVQTACSTSLVSVCVACRSLINRECDAAIAGGVALTFPQERGYFAADGGITSPDGRCAPFDARANGTVFSNGAGAVVLKRLADALADGDQIYAVIRGHALNNDGAKKPSFAAPSDAGHSDVIAQALENAGVTADSIGYIEAHGTATTLGDPVEIAGLSRVFRKSTDANQVCALGSVKGNIGHMDAASGISSLIKTALALRHETLPPTIHCETPNPALHLDESPFFLNTTKRPWPRSEQPRRAGVSSFGIGGTNAHVILEEAPLLAPTTPSEHAQVLVLSARSAAALDKRAADLAAHLEATPGQPLADAAFTLQTGRHIFQHRRAVVATDHTSAIAGLRAPAKLHRVEERVNTPVALLFPGQGSQYPGMGALLHASEPVFREALDRCAEILQPHLGLDLRELLFSKDENSAARLRETRFTQPAIFSMGYALGKLWLSLGAKPMALLGHSVGEFAAATLAGVFSLEDAARLVALRARLVNELPGGAMLAARLSEEEAREFLADSRLALAAINSPRLCVLSGPGDAIAALEETLTARNVAARRLATSHAFHSPMVESVVAPFAAAVKAVQLHPPTLPIVSCVSGDWLTPEEATSADYWAHHLRATVRFTAAIGRVLDDRGCALVEAGPGQTLSQLARQHQGRTAKHEVIHSIAEESDDNESLAAALARLWMAGGAIDWSAIHRDEIRRRVSLPGYPFERQRYFADLPAGTPMPVAIAGTDGDAPVDAAPAGITAPAPAPCNRTEQTSTPVPAPPANAPAAANLLAELQHLLTDLSGIDLASAPSSTTFLELGLDSLLLSQAAITISRKFGVKVTFRQLLQETGTLELLATHIANQRPAAAAPAPVSAPVVAAPTARTSPAPATAVHGPFRPPQREAGPRIGGQQQRWLDEFIRGYSSRTKGSKEYTQQHRPHFADPRAVSGFRREWKEIVYPIVVERSAGSKLWDIDGNEWLDMTLSFGAAMLGHQPKFVTDAITAQLARGMEIGPTSPLAGEVAKLICELTGSERAIFCNTGSEAVTGAVRAARTVTGRAKIVYFHESYHGIDNEVLGRRTGSANMPISPGMTREAVENTIILDYGDPRSLDAIAAIAGDIAAVLVEPVQSRRPALQPAEFLRALRDITQRHGIALIFDEVITGFRCHTGGAQAHFGIRADLATYGKVIGGGLPIGVIAGKAEYMDAFDGGQWGFGDESFPGAAVTFFAGTFVRHPLALAAAHAVLSHLKECGTALQSGLASVTGGMIARINAILDGSPFSAESFGSNWLVQTQPDFKFSGLLYALLRHHGLHIWEGRPCFVSAAHGEADLEHVVSAFGSAITALEQAGFFSRAKPAPAGATAETAIPLTESQQELWVMCQQSPAANSACNETWTLRLDGPLDDRAFRESLQAIVERHDALRSSFTPSGETLSVASKITIHVPATDLSTLPENERESCLKALRRAESVRVFDLKVAPLIALHLVRLAPTVHALIFNAHHIVCDGWSCDIFLRELATIYTARCGHRPDALPPAMQMRDYESWAKTHRDTPEFAADAAFWLKTYRTLPALLTLPGDRPYPQERSYRGGSEALMLPVEFPQMLTRFGAKHGATLFSVLLAGFQTLLFRLTGETNLAIGVPSAGQNLVEGEHLIGHCVNLLPMRGQLDGNEPFSELLKAVQAHVLEAFEHQQVTFGWLLQQLSFHREPGRVPLIPVTFNLDPALTQIRFSGLGHRIEANPRSAYQFDLGLNCDISAAGFRIVCNYNADLFDPATIRRWLGHFRLLLESATATPGEPLTRLAMLSIPEREELCRRGSATRTFAPDFCIHELFEQHAARTPAAVALTCENRRMTYGQLDAAANRLARHLRNAGVGTGTLVAVCVDRSIELIVSLLAVLKAGGAYVPLDPDSPGTRLELILADAKPGVLLTQEKLLSKTAGTGANVFCLDRDWTAIESLDSTALPPAAKPHSPAYVIYTSGSTGIPKGVVVTHHNVRRLFQATAPWFAFDERDVWTMFHSPAFDFSVWEMWGALCHGGRLVIVPYLVSRNAARFHRLLHDEGVTVLNQTPLAFQQLIHVEDDPSSRRDLKLRHVIFGGEALDFAALRPWFERHGDAVPKLSNMYGITETTVHVTFRPVVAADLERTTGSRIGVPIPDLDLFVLDSTLAPCPVGLAGEIYVGGAGVASGYLNRPELTAERFIAHPWKPGERLYKSGDLARWTADGDLEFLGRCDMQVKVNGFRIELGEIESAFLQHSEIQQAAVVPREAEGGGTSLVAYLVRPNRSALCERDVRTFLRQRLPGYMIPSALVWLDALPLNQNGKFDTKALPPPGEHDTGLVRIAGAAATLPNGATESRIDESSSSPTPTAAERESLAEWNRTERPFPEEKTLGALFDEAASRNPDATAIVDGDERVTYAALRTRANAIACDLQASGIRPGSLVGLPAERSARFVSAVLGIVKAGAAYVPLAPDEPSRRGQVMRSHCSCVLDWKPLPDGERDQSPTDDATATDPAYVLFTSGSTGVPKGVVVPHRAIARLVINNDFAPMTKNDVVAFASNVCFDAATFEIWGALLNGATLTVVPQDILLSPRDLGAFIATHGVTTLFLTTALFNQIARQLPAAFRPLTHLLFGGEACNAGCVRRALVQGAPRRLVHVYGPTEATTFATWHLVREVASDAITVPIGRPIANTTIHILDAHLQPVPVGGIGEIHIGGPGLATGYLDDDALTAGRFLDTPYGRLYKTGDLGRHREDGAIEFRGRADSQVKLRGFRIEPGEIEAALQQHPDVLQCAILANKNGEDEPMLAAYVVPRSGRQADSAAIREFLASRLPAHMIPSAFVSLDALPLTPNGKLDARKLPRPESSVPATSAAAVAPRNEIERGIAEIWSRVLGRKASSVRDDFFTVGGHSLLALRLLGEVRNQFGVEIPTRRLFETPTIEGLAAFVSEQKAAAIREEKYLVPIQRGDPAVQPLFLVPGGWGGEVEFLVYGELSRQIDPARPVWGLKARGAGTADPPHASVTEMATDYLREVRSIQPHGPYLLAGECVGGICAHEMACQLEQAGEDVALLVLLDTVVPSQYQLNSFTAAQARRLEEEMRKREAGARELTMRRRIRHHLDRMSGLSLGEKLGYISKKAFRRWKPDPACDGAVPNPHPRGQKDYPITLLRHRLQRYHGAVTLLLDEESSRLYGNFGWDKITVAGLETHILPGTHLSYIREDAATTAARLRELLNSATPNLQHASATA
jgi:amino acid adenylation domain-containing protein